MATNLKRVVVTGLGTISPLGLSVSETWRNALEGRSGVGPITLFDTKEYPVRIAAEVKGYDVTRAVGPFRPAPEMGDVPGALVTQGADRKEMRKMGRFIHFAIGASLEAYQDSGLDALRSKINPERIGVNIGSGMGGLGEIEASHTDLLQKGVRRVTPYLIPQIIPNLASGNVGILLNFKGPNLCNITACSSSAHSIGESVRLIQRGDADIMFAGGAEAVISPLGIAGFAQMRALSTRNEEPTKASRPFDSGRDGFVMGEGSAVLVLEEYEHAKKRGAKIYAEILGYGASGDAYHMTLPAPEGEGGYRAMKWALESSGIAPEKIGYVNAHGTSTPAGDVEEIKAVAHLFPNGPKHIHVSSTKSLTGHMLGAAGAIEAMFCILAIRDSRIPPTINLDNPDPECVKLGFNYCANQMVEKKLDYALSNSFGFGGTNACLIVGRV